MLNSFSDSNIHTIAPDNKYIIEKNWKFKILDSKPSQKEINTFYENGLESFTETHKEWVYDNNISIKEKLKEQGD